MGEHALYNVLLRKLGFGHGVEEAPVSRRPTAGGYGGWGFNHDVLTTSSPQMSGQRLWLWKPMLDNVSSMLSLPLKLLPIELPLDLLSLDSNEGMAATM